MDFATAISRVSPGTFVPDLGPDTAPTVSPIPPAGSDATPAAQDSAPSFKDTLKHLLSDVNDKVNTSDQNIRDLATGKTGDSNKVVTSVEEANLALSFTMAIRTKLLNAYTEIERMQV